jgi:hypothetical protein
MYGPTIFQLADLIGLFSRYQVPHSEQKMAAGLTLFRDTLISVIAGRVRVTSRA